MSLVFDDDKTNFFSRGINQETEATVTNTPGQKINCNYNTSYWRDSNSEVESFTLEVQTQIKPRGTVCFSKDSSFFIYSGDLSTKSTNVDGVKSSDFIIICDLQQLDENGNSQLDKSNTCKLKPEKPAYLVKWTRFGTVTKYKWSRIRAYGCSFGERNGITQIDVQNV